jgi:hypothetical protein
MRAPRAGLLLSSLAVTVLALPTAENAVRRPADAASTSASSTSTRAATASRTSLAKVTTRVHYIANVHTPGAAKRVGFNVMDTGTSQEQIDALPRGTQAMVWVGQKCPTRIDDRFRSVIRQLADDPKVFGYFLSDEPNIADCPRGPRHLARRADFIRRVTNGRQKSFIVLSATFPKRSYHAFRPQVTHVNMVGIDPYPCSVANPRCDFRKIRIRVREATHAGIRRSRMVPTFQVFGQENLHNHYYSLPTRWQLKAILNLWASLVPHPKMDFSYGWGHQASANPTLVDASGLRDMLHRYFAN